MVLRWLWLCHAAGGQGMPGMRPGAQAPIQARNPERHHGGVSASTGRKRVPEYLVDRKAVWLQLCRFGVERKKGDHDAARKFARVQYQKFYHEWPKHEYVFNGLPITDELKRQVMRNVIAYAKGQGGQHARVR
jgi:hypothetical protein